MDGKESLSIVKIEELLARYGVKVRYRIQHRSAVERCGFKTPDHGSCGRR